MNPKARLALIIILVSIVAIFTTKFLTNATNNREKGDVMDKWYRWKVKNIKNQQQKEVIEYLEKINFIFEKSIATVYKTDGSVWGYPDPERAVEQVNAQLVAAEMIHPPEICKSHYELTIEILKSIKVYQNERLRVVDNKDFEHRITEDQNLEMSVRNAKIARLKMEEERQKEYFNILQKVGFYDNAIDEMHKLHLISTKEKDNLKRE